MCLRSSSPQKEVPVNYGFKVSEKVTLEEVPDRSILYLAASPRCGHLVARQIP